MTDARTLRLGKKLDVLIKKRSVERESSVVVYIVVYIVCNRVENIVISRNN